MIKNYASVCLLLLSAGSFSANAQEWFCTKESKYNSSNALNGEIYYHYNGISKQSILRNELDATITLKSFDNNGNVILSTEREFDEWDNNWFTDQITEYTYNEQNKLASQTRYIANWSGVMNINNYTEYLYNEQGYLTTEKQYQSNEKLKTLAYIEYLNFNENGKPARKNIYSDYDENPSLSEYSEYLYNNNSDLTLETVYQKNIFTNEIGLYKKYSWSFNESGQLEQYISYSISTEGSLYADAKKDYLYDTATNQLASETNYYWNTTNEQWVKTITYKYTYSNELTSDKAPTNLKSVLEDGSYTLSWEAPADQNGLTGYNVYRGHELALSVPASQTTFVVDGLAKGTTSVFVTSVYGKQEANASEYVDLEYIESEVYPTPIFGGISNIRLIGEFENPEFEIYWSAPETDKEVKGYTVYFNHWPQNENLIKGTTHTFTVMRYNPVSAFGVSATYTDGNTSEEDYREYNVDDLITSIQKSSMGREIWSFGGNICIDGSNIRAVEIYDAAGMKVMQKEMKEGINTLPLSKSVYIIKAVTANGVKTVKLFNE